MDPERVAADLAEVVVSEQDIARRVRELAAEIGRDYAERDLLVVGVLDDGAVATVDIARALDRHAEIGWMAITSRGSGFRTSGVVRLRKDLGVDVAGRDVLIVDAVLDTGVTAAWLMSNLRARGAASVAFCGMFRKPSARDLNVEIRYVGFEVPDGVVVGYGLDFGGRYRNLPCCALLSPAVFDGAVSGRTSSNAV
jgi:hypoxanthine phosphoribosyltransferase